MKKYDKLVRDKIIKIIEKDGKKADYELVEGEEFEKYLVKKLQEEVNEFKEEGEIEEIADILEVIEALLSVNDLDWEDVFELKERKAKKRGKFDKGIILKKVWEG